MGQRSHDCHFPCSLLDFNYLTFVIILTPLILFSILFQLESQVSYESFSSPSLGLSVEV